MKTKLLLENILNDGSFSVEVLDSLLAENTTEDLHLEYKHGNELKKNNATNTIRSYVSGFANSAGGVLIIGIDDKTLQVTGCSAPGGGSLAEWAARCLTPLARYFSPPPKIFSLKHTNGDVLVIAVNRSLNLIPTVEGNILTYYIRFHDQTIKAPDYLITDILLGRRMMPELDITKCTISNYELTPRIIIDKSLGLYYQDYNFDLFIKIENQSLVWADDVEIGLIGCAVGDDDESLVQQLRFYIEISTTQLKEFDRPLSVRHKRADNNLGNNMRPFTSILLNISNIKIPFIRPGETRYKYIWKSGLYLMSKNSPPVWYQLSLPINSLPDWEKVKDLIMFERLNGQPPIISLSEE